MAQAPVTDIVVTQHAEEAAHLSEVRSVLLGAPHVRLLQLSRIDERIAAHLDGLFVAGPAGMALVRAGLDDPNAGTVFAAAALSLARRDHAAFKALLPLAGAGAGTAAWSGMARALGWVSAADLQGIVGGLLQSADAAQRCLGLAACRMHQVDPGPAILLALTHEAPAAVRAAALRIAGELGRKDVLPHALELLKHEHPEVAFWAAWAASLQGDRGSALGVLQAAALQDKAWSPRALSLFMAAASREQAEALARHISAAAQAQAANMGLQRLLLRTLGLLGDARFVPWLVERMAEPPMMRLAGEAFSLITGADLALLGLERMPPEGIDFGPNDNPEDENVAMDEDDNLPWPDQAKARGWWQANASTFVPGQRYFLGKPPSLAHGIQVLRDRGQRHRTMAAEYLCLLRPGSKLFPVAAPAWRQSRWLAAEGGALP